METLETRKRLVAPFPIYKLQRVWQNAKSSTKKHNPKLISTLRGENKERERHTKHNIYSNARQIKNRITIDNHVIVERILRVLAKRARSIVPMRDCVNRKVAQKRSSNCCCRMK